MQLDGNVLLVCHSKVIQFVFFLLLLVVVWINTHTTTTEKTHNAQQIEQSIYFDEYNITTTDVICFDYVKLKLIKISI